MDDAHFAYKQNRSTLDAVATFTHHIASELDKGRRTSDALFRISVPPKTQFPDHKSWCYCLKLEPLVGLSNSLEIMLPVVPSQLPWWKVLCTSKRCAFSILVFHSFGWFTCWTSVQTLQVDWWSCYCGPCCTPTSHLALTVSLEAIRQWSGEHGLILNRTKYVCTVRSQHSESVHKDIIQCIDSNISRRFECDCKVEAYSRNELGISGKRIVSVF